MAEAKTKILVVDDDLRLRDLLNRYLTEQGFAVRAVSDAHAMDQLLARERFDLHGARPDAARRGRAVDLPAAARHRQRRSRSSC